MGNAEFRNGERSVEELEENIRDAYLMLALEDVPADYQVKKIAV